MNISTVNTKEYSKDENLCSIYLSIEVYKKHSCFNSFCGSKRTGDTGSPYFKRFHAFCLQRIAPGNFKVEYKISTDTMFLKLQPQIF